MQAKLWLPLRAARWALLLLIGSLSSAGAIAQSEPPSEAPEAIAPRSSSAPLPQIDRPFLKLGSQGADVSEVQALLRLLGYYTGAVDGVYSESTAAAVANFQKTAGLTADGIVGPATWRRLLPSSSEAIAPTDTRTSAGATSFPRPAPSDRGPTTPQAAPPATPQPAAPEANPAARAAAPTSPETSEGSAPAPEAAPEEVTLPILRRGDRGPAVTQLQERLKAIKLYQGEVDGIFGEGTEVAVEAAQKDAGLTADGVVGPATWQALLRRQ